MKFIEEKLEFKDKISNEKHPLEKSFGLMAKSFPKNIGDIEEAGIVVRIGKNPIVYSYERLLKKSNSKLSPQIEQIFEKRDVFSIVHAVGIIRQEGKAAVDELQYHAEVNNVKGAQTIALIPDTRFKKALTINGQLEGCISAMGTVSAGVPEDLSKSLLPDYLDFGANMKVQLSSNMNFLGKFSYTVFIPITQSIGIGSNQCDWVLNPDMDKSPLLGDQLMIQNIAVPKGTQKLKYKVFGRVKVDRGLFYHQQEKQTKDYTLDVSLT